MSEAKDGRRYGGKGWRYCETHQRCFRGAICNKCELDRRRDRIKALEEGLAEAIDGMRDMIAYVPEYFREKWKHDKCIEDAEKVRREIALRSRVERLEAAIRHALADSETERWGPDVTVAGYLREALEAPE